MNSFHPLALSDQLMAGVDALGWEQPTAVQQQAIPVVAAGSDLAAQAQTGSGKTAAFALPILQRLSAHPSPPTAFALVVVPTRELALQVAAAFTALARFMASPPGVVAVIGGQPIEQQIADISGGTPVVVATPGRLLDLLQRQELVLDDLHTLVLDEADKLLDLGFADELQQLMSQLPAQHQSLLFSATLPAKVLALAKSVLHDPVEVRIESDKAWPTEIDQRAYQVDADKRRGLLQHLLTNEAWARTLVFVATQRRAETLSAKLRRAGFGCSALHGGLDQDSRIEVLRRFKARPIGILIATDLAARGIDIPELSTVVNYDLPRSTQDYVHRIGRTGRAGESGLAVSFIDHDSAHHFALIEKRGGVTIPRQVVAGFELTGTAPRKQKGGAPKKGKRMSKKDKLRAQARRAEQDEDDGR